MNEICPICRGEYAPQIDLTERVKCKCGATADTSVIMEFNQALELLLEWQKSIIGRVLVKPEPKYLDWFVKLNRDTNSFLLKEY